MVSVVIPTYQERENIEPLLGRLEKARGHLLEPLEVLIVDSGSPDGTAQRAREILERARLGRVIENPDRADLAAAVMEGMREAHGDLIAVMDADLSHPPELLPSLVGAVRAGAPVAVASRYVRGGKIRDWPLARRALSRLGSLIARPLVPVSDATSGYFVCEASRIRPLALRPRGFKILLEILVRGNLRPVSEIPYVFVDRARGASKLDGGVLWRYLEQLLRLYAYRLRSGLLRLRGMRAPTASWER